MPTPLPTKTCVQCGRIFSWRKKWAQSWEQVRFCSQACRKKGAQDPADLAALLGLLRAAPKRTLMLDSATEAKLSCPREALRARARLLAHAGQATLYVKGRRVSPEEARGQVELRLA